MDTIFTTMHHIDLIDQQINYKELNVADAQRYIARITDEVLYSPNKKYYQIKREGTEVVRIVKSTFMNGFLSTDEQDTIAQRLLETEIETQEKIKHLGKEVKKGSLIQSLFSDEDYSYFIITKIESNRFLDENDLTSRDGLPFDKKAVKACVFKMKKPNEIVEIVVSDNNKKISDYWFNGFLELKPLTDDEENTKDSFKVLSTSLRSNLKDRFPADYILCRNNLLSFYKTNPTFRLEDIVSTMFDNYVPASEELDIDNLKGKFANTYRRHFKDTEFTIKPKVIKNRQWKETKPVNGFVDVTLNGSDDQIKNSICSEELNGEKYIKIKATEEKTFNSFKWKD